jgi:hypothetical protein
MALFQTQLAREVLGGEVPNNSLRATINRLKNTKRVYRTFDITPEDASFVLKNCQWKNRNICSNAVSAYAQQMKNGEYIWNGHSIKIGQDADHRNTPILMDGQHRLTAITVAHTPIKAEVLFYPPYTMEQNKKIMETLDRGKNRTTRDVFALNSIPNGRSVVTLIKLLLSRYNQNSTLIGVARNYLAEVTDQDYLRFYNDNEKEIQATICLYKRFVRAKIFHSSAIAALYYRYRFDFGNKGIDEIMKRFQTGANLSEKSATLKIRLFLERCKADQAVGSMNRIPPIKAVLALNMYFDHIHNKGDDKSFVISDKAIEAFVNSHNQRKLEEKKGGLV